MDPKKEADLVARFPKVFTADYMDGRTGPVGIGVGPGWFNLLEKVGEQVTYVLSKADHPEARFIPTTIKEKFGTLRFYWGASNISSVEWDIINSIVDMAEQLSYNVCEDCGEIGKQRNRGGWTHTLCQKCFDKLK